MALALAFAAGEIAARALNLARIAPLAKRDGGLWYDMVHRRASVPGLAYELVPGLDRESIGVHLRTNSLGMRDSEPQPVAPDLVRILALGDSITFGWSVEEEQSFCWLLERDLADSPLARGRRFELLNTGVSGYSTRDEVAALEGKWLALAPRLVLVCYSLNDPEIEPNQPLSRYFADPPWWQSSQLALAVHKWLERRRIAQLGQGNWYRYLHEPSTNSWRSVQAGFARLDALARERGFQVAIVIFPMFHFTPWSEYEFRREQAQVAAEAARHGFAVLDLLPRFEREDPHAVTLKEFDPHPTPLGHAIAAEEILRFLESHPELLADAH